MNWKEFFKPSKGKIIVLIILVLFSMISTSLSSICVINIPLIQGGPGSFAPTPEAPSYCGLVILIKNIFNPLNYEIIGGYVDKILASVIYSIYFYLLSCIIITLYHKIRKK